ncbi:hypothetical protein C9J41_04380 [Photobacterium sp. GB-50]|nr:hypothetical protein C9J41_04380 [Photobacterium sp. GB-50]
MKTPHFILNLIVKSYYYVVVFAASNVTKIKLLTRFNQISYDLKQYLLLIVNFMINNIVIN